MDGTVLELKKALRKSIEASKFEQSCDILKRLSEITATKELLKKTEIGIEVSKLKKHTEPKVAKLALDVLNRWKKDVGIKLGPSHHVASPELPSSSSPSLNASTASVSTISSTSIKVTSSVTTNTSSSSTTAAASITTKTIKPSSSSSETAPHKNALSNSSSFSTNSIHSSSSSTLSSTSLNSSASGPLEPDASQATSTSTSTSTSPSNGSVTSFPERSATIDQITIPCTGNPTRNKCIEMLYNALCVNTLVASDLILQKSALLERSLLDKHQGQVTSQYKADVRMFYANLKHKQNSELREAMLTGQIAMHTFIHMTPAEMAPGSLKKEMEEMKKVNLFLARAAGNTKAETDLFKCNKCKRRRTSYYQLQTRSADEPMTTFVECLECGHHWKFC